MQQLYKIDTGAGASPLRVYGSAGDLIFDADFASISVYGLFSATIPANSFYPGPYSPNDGTSGNVVIPFGKVFARPPLHTPLIQSAGVWAIPGTSFTSNQTNFAPNGQFATAFTDKIILATFNFQQIRMSVCVFENGVYG